MRNGVCGARALLPCSSTALPSSVTPIFDEPDLENTELLQVFFIGFVHMPLIIDVLSAGGVEMRRYIKGIYLALSHMHKDCIM